VSPVKYELGFYIPEDDVLHNQAVKTANLTSVMIIRERQPKLQL
jgi:hypothetical protein